MIPDKMPGTEDPDYGLTRKERRSADRYRKINERAPAELRQRILAELTRGLCGKDIVRGDNLGAIVARECPGIDGMAAEYGYQVDWNLPENGARNMAKGKLFFVLEPLAKRKLH